MPRPGNVAATEPSERFVAALRQRFPELDVRSAPAEELPWPDESFDAALAQLVVSFLADAPAAANELRRVLRPGGTAAVCMWGAQGVDMFVALYGAGAAVAPDNPPPEQTMRLPDGGGQPRPAGRRRARGRRHGGAGGRDHVHRVRRLLGRPARGGRPRRVVAALAGRGPACRRPARRRTAVSAARAAPSCFAAGPGPRGPCARRPCSGARQHALTLGAGADQRHTDAEFLLDELDVAPRGIRAGRRQIRTRRAARPNRAASRTRDARRGSRSGGPGSRSSPRRRAAGSARTRAAPGNARARRASSARAGRCR